MTYDVIIVGGGIAGLTASAYLSKAGKKVLLCEKGEKIGGLVSTFNYKGFTLDGGIRAIENSGIVKPMLKDLGIDVPFKRSVVTLGIEDEVIKIEDLSSLEKYQSLLSNKFPNEKDDIKKVVDMMKQLMKYMDILYGIDNPLFLDIKRDKAYFQKEILPWMFKFMFTVGKIKKYQTPVETYLANLTKNESLNNVIAQHFFKQTPTFFALSYFSLYLDYNYPLEGTGMLIDKINQFILDHGVEILLDTTIESIDLKTKTIKDQNNETYTYDQLLWAADTNKLYQIANLESIPNKKLRQKALAFKDGIKNLRGSDSIQTTYMLVDLDPSYFENICTAHFFYTPKKTGDGKIKETLPLVLQSKDQKVLFDWINDYLDNTTFEISMPALRNRALAPEGQTGLIVSTLMEFDLVKHISDLGLYDQYKSFIEQKMVDILDASIFKGFKSKVFDTFGSSPLTILNRTGNKDGAITGWAFTNNNIPAVTSFLGVTKAVKTYIPDVVQAGQWSYSPAGLPVSIMTGKIASDYILKKTK